MAAKELWTNLVHLGNAALETSKITPKEILLTQANALKKGTNQAIEAIVELGDSDDSITYDFILYVPELSGYMYTLLEISHKYSLYPLELRDYTTSQKYTCENEEKFIATLKDVLNSPSVTEVLSNLLRLQKLEVQGQDEGLS
jgi:hypothetical protein